MAVVAGHPAAVQQVILPVILGFSRPEPGQLQASSRPGHPAAAVTQLTPTGKGVRHVAAFQ